MGSQKERREKAAISRNNDDNMDKGKTRKDHVTKQDI